MNLLDYRHDVYSSTGNDGIIKKIFEILEIENGFFVEFGAWDGIKGSNCRRLYENGWSGIFIEPELNRYRDLVKNYRDAKNIICINSAINRKENKFDNVVRGHVRSNIDFCSIDIDGLDLEIFESFEEFMPTVVCLEGGQMLEPLYPRVSERVASKNIQQSLKVINDSFGQRGYKILCSYQDTFFVKEEYYDLFDVSNNIMELYLAGLYVHHRRLPWIQFIISQVGIKNKLIDYILQKSNYNKYGYNNRKLWTKEEKTITLEVIKELQNRFKEVKEKQ